MYLKRCCQSHVSFMSAYFSCRSQPGNYWPRQRSQSSWAAVPVSYSHPSEGLGLWSLRRTGSAGFPLQPKQNNDLISLSFKGITISALTRNLDVMENRCIFTWKFKYGLMTYFHGFLWQTSAEIVADSEYMIIPSMTNKTDSQNWGCPLSSYPHQWLL